MTPERPTVLVVEDNEELADMYSEWLTETYTVLTAYDGDEALALLGDEVDVVLLDRLMPDCSGDEVLARLVDEGIDCRVALVTAVEPDLDIVDMAFDEYLTKPVRKGDLYHVVESLLTRGTYTESYRQYHALTEKRSLLEEEVPSERLAASEEYDQLVSVLDSLREYVDHAGSRWRGREEGSTVFRRLAHHLRSPRKDD
ncbi:response regulator [Halomarina litorea]|uniref:response regulator n=1 Tax=Halomarina litorea TaxID=2961595 RepID=UPI0020C2805E|nr:response regulator [Halomarina sp. BCD28]